MHTLDAARLYRLALESAPAGTRLHGVADEGVPFRDIAEVIGRHLDLPVKGISGDQVRRALRVPGPLRGAGRRDVQHADAEDPGLASGTAKGLLDDLDEGHYFAEEQH